MHFLDLAAALRVIARSEATKQSIVTTWLWIASRSLSSGAHSRDPFARNDGGASLPTSHFKQPTVYRHGFAISPRLCARVLPEFPILWNQRAQGMPGARCTRRWS